MNKQISIFYFTKNGEEKARKIGDYFKCKGEIVEFFTTTKVVAEAFSSSKLLVFVSAVGIAVRSIAPFIVSKISDPAVVTLDDMGNFVISLLSGHIGGGNDFAKEIADLLLATPVITTATDVNGRFSCDAWAKKNNCLISSMNSAKNVSARILKEKVAIKSDFEVLKLHSSLEKKEKADLGIYVTYKTQKPFEETLSLYKKALVVGIGCRRGTKMVDIENQLVEVFESNNLALESIKMFGSIDIKADEIGLLELGKKYNVPLEFYTKQQLNSLEGDFTPSSFVKKITDVDNVCERSAVFGGGRLIVRKVASNGVTVAVALREVELEIL